MGVRGTRRSRNELDDSKNSYCLMRDVDDILTYAKKNNFYQGDKLDILSLISSIPDIEISMEEFDSKISGSLSKEKDKWIIRVNKTHDYRRQKFTIAHELGHYVLHRDLGNEFSDVVFFRGMTNDGHEYEANDFASDLLMPESRILYYWNVEHIHDIAVLSDLFGVSAPAMMYRIKKLGCK